MLECHWTCLVVLALETANGWMLPGGWDELLNQTLAALLSICPSFTSLYLWTFMDIFGQIWWWDIVFRGVKQCSERLLHVLPPLKQRDHDFASEPSQKAAGSWAVITSHVELEFDNSSYKSLLKIFLGAKREGRRSMERVWRRGETAKDKGHKWVGNSLYLVVVPTGHFS